MCACAGEQRKLASQGTKKNRFAAEINSPPAARSLYILPYRKEEFSRVVEKEGGGYTHTHTHILPLYTPKKEEGGWVDVHAQVHCARMCSKREAYPYRGDGAERVRKWASGSARLADGTAARARKKARSSLAAVLQLN